MIRPALDPRDPPLLPDHRHAQPKGVITTISLTLIDCALIAIISAIITAFTGFVCFILGVMAGTWLGMQD